MAIKDIIFDNLYGFSLAKYSTWMYYKPTRTIFDAGEGLSTSMRNFAFGIDSVFLSHGHHDHIGGLPGLILSRASARGDKEKPLTIYHPGGWESIRSMKEYVRVVGGKLPFELKWVPIDHERSVVIGEGKSRLHMNIFPTHHGRNPTVGYAIVEKRNRLRKDLIGLSGSEIAEISKRDGKNAVSEFYDQIVFAYSGDTSPVHHEFVTNAEVLVHEATFVDPKDVDCDRNGHSSVLQAIQVASDSNAKLLILCHFSGRYSKEEAIACILNSKSRVKYNGDIILFWRNEMIPIR